MNAAVFKRQYIKVLLYIFYLASSGNLKGPIEI